MKLNKDEFEENNFIDIICNMCEKHIYKGECGEFTLEAGPYYTICKYEGREEDCPYYSDYLDEEYEKYLKEE